MLKLMAALFLMSIPITIIAEGKTNVVVMLGDSTTLCSRNKAGAKLTDCIQGYLMQMQSQPFTLINAGQGGDTAKGGYARLAAAVLEHDPDVVTISFGLNDTILLAPDEYRLWLEKIVRDLRQQTRAKIMLVTSTPFNNARHACAKRFDAKGGLDKYMDDNICAQTRNLAREHGLPLCDLHRYFADKFAQDPSLIDVYILPDGVHLTDAGNKAAAEYLAPMISTLICEPAAKTNSN